MNWINKKTTQILLSIAFFVVCFSSFVNTANAATIEDDVVNFLGLPFPASELAGSMDEIPSDLRPDQRAFIISNIVNSTLVQGTLQTVFAAVQTAAQKESDYEAAKEAYTSSSPEAQNAFFAWEEAKSALQLTISDLKRELGRARRTQDSVIANFERINAADNLFDDRLDELSTATTTQELLTSQNQDDIAQASVTPSAIDDETRDAMRQQRDNANEWMKDDNLAVKMQEDCVIWSPTAATNLTPCIAIAAYYVIYKPTQYALMGTGIIFDAVLDLSIKKEFVADQPFINSSWKVVRDFSNMLFIFILLYTGIMTMFGAADWRKTVLRVIFIALLINFSLFFTKVIIDAGNILAVGISSNISPESSISQGLAGAFQPQQFINIAGKVSDISGGQAMVVFFVAATVSGFAAYVFFKMALLLIGRLIAFWFLMIVSPFAFISITLPKGNKFQEWLDTLLAQAFVAPVFLFFIYLIMTVISAGGGVLSSITAGGGPGWFNSLLTPVIIATLLCLALMKALHFAEDMAGSFGKLGAEMAGKAMGMTAMVATGGTAMLGRQAVGRMAGAALKGGIVKEGTAMGSAAKWATRASFDVRNAGVVSKGFGALGIDAGKGGGVGGREAAEEKRIKGELKAAEGSKVSIFTEQGIRARAEEEAKKKGDEKRKEEIEAAETFAKAASKLTAELEKSVKATQEEHDKPVREAEVVYKESQQKFEKYKGTEHEPLYQKAMDEAKDKIATAKATQSSSPTSVALKSTMAKLEAAKRAEKDALEKVKKVSQTAEESAKETIGEINKAAITKLADKTAKGGWFTKKRLTTADKIRKLNKEESDTDKITKMIEKAAAKEAKKAAESETKTEEGH